MTDRIRFEMRTAFRSLRAAPVPAVAAVVTLAMAVGVNLAMAGLIGRALLSPPAHVADADRVFTVAFHNPGDAGGAGMTTTSYVAFTRVRDEAPALSGAAAFQRTTESAMVEGEQRRVNAMLVSGSYFDVLGVRPVLGGGFSADSDQAGAAPVAVLSHAFWRAAWGGDRAVLERRLNIRGIEYTIAGVMPEGFSGHASTAVDLWVPIAAAMRDTPGWDRDAFRNIVSVVVRVAPGRSASAAATQAGTAVNRRVTLAAIAGAEVGATEQRVAWWLTGVALLIFVIGLANAGTLLIVRASRRRHDTAIRAALGASRRRLIAHALVDAIVVSAAATSVSLLLAPWLDEGVRRVLFPGLVAATGSLGRSTAATAALAGVAAALVAAAANCSQLPSTVHPASLAASGHGSSRRTKTMTGLLLVQTTLCVVLLAGAGLFGRSFYKLASQDFGMQMDGVVVVDFENGPGPVSGTTELLSAALQPVRTMPGVQMATAIDGLPFGGHNVPPISVPGHAEPPAVGLQLPFLNAATPELLQILGVQVVEGRPFTAADDRGAPVVIVNQTMARGVWPGESALGTCIRIGFDPDFDPSTAAGPPVPSDRVPCREVIGVARDVRQRSLLPVDNEDRLMQYFVPFSQVPAPPFAGAEAAPVRALLLRVTTAAETVAPAIRRIVVGQRRDLPYVRVRPYAQLLDRQLRPWRLGTTLLAWFSALALAVAAVGLYAAFAHAVAERRREMAIRIAIGAPPGGVLRMVLGDAVSLAAAGAACGCVAAVFAGRLVQSLLFGTTPSDPLVLAGAAAAMVIVAAGATLLPARAASRADPNVLLRTP